MADTLELRETLSHKDLANIILKNSYFWVKDNKRTVGLKQVWFCVKTRFPGAGSATDHDVYIPQMLPSVQPDRDMLRQDLAGFFIPADVFSVNACCVPPLGGTMLLSFPIVSV